MKISFNWLKDYIDIPKSIIPEKLGELLTLHSVEIEEVIDQAKDFENIVVGKVLEIKKHPNADKLKLVKVDITTPTRSARLRAGPSLKRRGEVEPVQVVCGGTNLREGMLVAFAKVGAKIRWHGEGDLITLEKAKIRGEVSEGMICAPVEIGLDQYQKGDTILLDLGDIIAVESLQIGTSLANALGLNDTTLEVDNKTITNRPDLWGHYGMAREIAAILKLKVKSEKACPEPAEGLKVKHDYKLSASSYQLDVEVKDYKLCPRYQAVVVDNIKIEPSPLWLQLKLTAAAVRPINNIVDITNYVMLDLGQPIHAFDYSKLSPLTGGVRGGRTKIIVRRAKNGEKITTLDGIERELEGEMLVIADQEKPIAIAGVMGGANSEIDDKTVRIVIESANFEPINNRKTSAKLGLRTEAVMRYEKSLDPNLTEITLNKVLELISEIIPQSNIASKIADQKKFRLNQGPIELSTNYVQRKIGVKIDSKQIADILTRLGFEVSPQPPLAPPSKGGGTTFKVKIPTWRATKDVSNADDLVEEVARIYGFDKIKPAMPLVEMKAPEVNQERKFERQVKNILNGLNFDEVYNYAMISEEHAKKIGRNPHDYIKLLNSISQEYRLLRQSLLENLMVNIKNNLRYFDKFKIFELGSTFQKTEGRYLAHPDKKGKLPRQEKFIGGVIIDVDKKPDEIFFQTKEAIENLLNKIEINNYKIAPINACHSESFDAAQNKLREESRGKSNPANTTRSFANAQDDSAVSADIIVNNKKIGQIGLLNKNIQQNFDINSKIVCGFFELSFDELFSLPKPEIKYRPLAKFPEVKIDLALLAPKEILWHNIEEEIKKAAGAKLKKIELFDIYEGKNIGAGKKNLAMHLSFGEDDGTMEMGEVEVLRDKIVAYLKNKLNINIRS